MLRSNIWIIKSLLLKIYSMQRMRLWNIRYLLPPSYSVVYLLVVTCKWSLTK